MYILVSERGTFDFGLRCRKLALQRNPPGADPGAQDRSSAKICIFAVP
jgi:hypothetical protein